MTEPPRRRAILPVVFAGTCSLVAALACAFFGLAWSASSAAWWTGDAPGWPALVRAMTRALGPQTTLLVMAVLVGTSLLAAVVAAAWRLQGPMAALLAGGLLLLWPDARALLATVSAESMLAVAALATVHAAWLLPTRPRMGALLVAVSMLAAAASHPLALPMLPLLTAVPLLWPRVTVPGAAPLAGDEVGPRPRPVLVAWFAGVCLAVGVLLATAPLAAWKQTWTADLAILRAPQAGLRLGPLASLPGIGPWLAWLGRTPVLLLVLALASASRLWRRPEARETPLFAVLGLWLLAFGWAGQPVPGHLDSARLLAPLVVVLAATAARQLLAVIWARPRWAIALGVVAVLQLAGDLALQMTGDQRTSLGRLPGALTDAEPLQPAELRSSTLAMLVQQHQPTALLPARAGSQALAAALPLIEPGLRGVYFGPAYASQLVLIADPARHLIDRSWRSLGQPVACAGGTCLIRRTEVVRPR